jgi:hypothetical protein
MYVEVTGPTGQTILAPVYDMLEIGTIEEGVFALTLFSKSGEHAVSITFSRERLEQIAYDLLSLALGG